MKVAVVVQRYGAEINGGAEQHARYIAERLARHVEVEVLTTCATDYITWRNDLPPGEDRVHGVVVRRFPVTRERDPIDFGRASGAVFARRHSIRDELAWLEAEGPTSPALVDYIRAREAAFDFFLFFSVRYYHAFHGVRAVPGKAILVPTAERDAAIGLGIFGPVFRGVRALMYNSHEERALIHAVSGNGQVPGIVVGVGSMIPQGANAERFRRKTGIRDRFALYIGRVDENKGCRELFAYFEQYCAAPASRLRLVLIGNPVIPVPDHPRIHHLGFVSDEEKYDALAASDLLVMPSYLESLSMAVLEAWALGRPVLVNGACDVLRGQVVRSNGGLYYENIEEFFEALRAMETAPALAAALGRSGRAYFDRHYAWPVIERKYIDMLNRLSREPDTRRMEPLPGWFARRRRTLSPADEVVRALPTGPALDSFRPEQARAGRPGAWRPRPDESRANRPGPERPRPDRQRAEGPRTAPDRRTPRAGAGAGRPSGGGPRRQGQGRGRQRPRGR